MTFPEFTVSDLLKDNSVQVRDAAVEICGSWSGHSVKAIAFCDTPHTARAIGHCVNTHDALVKALEGLADVFEHDCECAPCIGSMAPGEHYLGLARAALALAKGEGE